MFILCTRISLCWSWLTFIIACQRTKNVTSQSNVVSLGFCSSYQQVIVFLRLALYLFNKLTLSRYYQHVPDTSPQCLTRTCADSSEQHSHSTSQWSVPKTKTKKKNPQGWIERGATWPRKNPTMKPFILAGNTLNTLLNHMVSILISNTLEHILVRFTYRNW